MNIDFQKIDVEIPVEVKATLLRVLDDVMIVLPPEQAQVIARVRAKVDIEVTF